MAGTSLTCVDVRTLGRYRVVPSEDHTPGAPYDPWNLEIECFHGRIYPHGGTRLQAYTDGPQYRNRLKALPCVKIHQDGDFETTVIFDAKDFETVAAILKPKKVPPGRTAEELESIRTPGWWRRTAKNGPRIDSSVSNDVDDAGVDSGAS